MRDEVISKQCHHLYCFLHSFFRLFWHRKRIVVPDERGSSDALFFGVLIFFVLLQLTMSGCSKPVEQDATDVVSSDLSGARVLMIASYSPSFRTFYKQINGVKSILDPYKVQLDHEFMDTKRFFTEENIALFYEHLKYKLNNLPAYDAVITTDDDATNFVMEHRRELFGDTPIFFMGVNNYDNAVLYDSEDGVTGVFEAPSYHETIEMAKKLNPEATRVVGLVDATSSGQGDLTLFLAESENFSELEFDTLDLKHKTFSEFASGLETLSNQDIVILISVYRDYEGTTYTFEEGMRIVMEHCIVPVYHPYEHGIGEGLLGGMVVSHIIQGEHVASQVLEYLQGTPINKIPLVDKSPNRYMIDWSVFQAFDLDSKQLPKDVIIVNRQVKFWEKYAKWIIITFFIFLVEGLIIASLLYFLRTSKKVGIQLRMMNRELAISLRDVEARDERIHDLIYKDTLTGLNNRFAIYEKIDNQISEHSDVIFAVMFLDIDNFKNVNDLFGHDVGDELIRETGRQLGGLLEEGVQVGRFGGDEFVFLISKYKTVEELTSFIDKVRLIFRECLSLKNQIFYLTISIGVSIYPDHGNNKEELIKKSDIALYEAKKRGKDKFVIFDASMDAALKERIQFQQMLRTAFDNSEFELYYQPLIKTENQAVLGFEALLRWHNDQLGFVSPDRMISVAEEIGLILPLGEWIFTKAVKYAKQICGDDKNLFVAINISTIQLANSGFYNFVMETVRKFDVKPRCICLEVTEAVFLKRDGIAADLLQRLSKAGFRISLDDFGTGYASLSYLKQIKIDMLKIDRNYVENMVKDAYDRNLIELMIEISQQKSACVVAEGVELKDQVELLRAMNCDILQGFYFSKPLPAAEALLFLRERVLIMSDNESMSGNENMRKSSQPFYE